MFAVTNIDDILVLALFFGRCAGHRGAAVRVVIGQYLGFAAILVASLAGALGAGLLPRPAIAYLGLLPLLLGIRAAWGVWRDRHGTGPDAGPGPDAGTGTGTGTASVLTVAAVTFANGGDNIGVYVPVFATAGPAGLVGYSAVFLVLVGVWCGVGRFLATRPPVARTLARFGHLLLPAVLIGIGLLILVEGHAFGL
ncbi:cadmium resistance transporter [Pseudonocardia sp. Cha107L01]|uniref:cadmium resistance transporter n=1 Tax=Pseudonocardia sp. Cha107L01 TaxID=3457576 RepID=UPI00403E4201